jgi:diguanylate cyclase (GGDEF)-like protein
MKRMDLLRLQNAVLKLLAESKPLEVCFDRLCTEVEILTPNVLCSVLAVDPSQTLRPIAAPSLPTGLSEAFRGVLIGPAVGSCGTSAFKGCPVSVEDIETDLLWKDYKHLMGPLGLRACWSSPIFNSDCKVVGTFAFYYKDNRGPNDKETAIVAACVHLCSIAFDRDARISDARRLAFYDPLTGILNRRSFNEAMDTMPCDKDDHWSLLAVDVDNLKVINDTFGHQAGDCLLQVVSNRIVSAAEENAVYRIGGDEFGVVLRGKGGDSKLSKTAAAVLKAIKEPAVCGGHTISPQATLGGACIEDGLRKPESVRQNADLALYHAKDTSPGSYVRYYPGLSTTMMQRFKAVQALSDALREDRVVAHYQPVSRLETGEIVGLEALCRIQNIDGSILSAAAFHSATSDVQVASRLTDIMLDHVVADLRSWTDCGVPIQHVAINVSFSDFQDGLLYRKLYRRFKDADISLEHLILEVTESVYLGRQDRSVADEIKSLRSKGIRIALDDFGTGYASLTHLLSVPVDIIKIDKTFVDGLKPDSKSAIIVEGLISVATKLGIRVVAEGIEEACQSAQLQQLGCILGQGFLFGKPDNAFKTTEILRARSQASTDNYPAFAS